MTLYVLNASSPLGEFDVLDGDQASVTGGQVMTLDEASRTVTASEKAAADALDGYIADQVDAGSPTATRVQCRLADSATEALKLFYLADDGVAGYGTLFGSLIGNPVGLTVSGGTALGPHSASGSGKVTLWHQAGLYAVSTDALSADVIPATGNLNDTPLPGEYLFRGDGTGDTAGTLTRSATSGDQIAQFVELSNSGSLVNTPAHLVGATEAFDRIKIMYLGAAAAAAAQLS